MIESEEYQQGYRDGYNAAIRKKAKFPEQADWAQCRVCKMTFDRAMGYVCSDPKCPTRVIS